MINVETLANRVEELHKKFDVIIEMLQSGTAPPKTTPCDYTLYAWLEEWQEIYKKPKIKATSLREINICINNHIKPNIEDKPLNEITGIEVQKALNKIKQSRTKKYTYNVYNGAFRQAQRLKIILENPMISVDPVQHQYNKGKALTREQQAEFYKIIANNKFKELYRFYILSGCRRNEAIELCWNDVDFKNKQLHIRGTKTETSNRIIPLFDEIEYLLKRLPKKSEKVFDCTADALQCNFKRIKNKYALPYRIHDLRHTFATRCLENGISLKTIQKWLGHSRLETTSNIYTHVQTDFEREEIAKYNSKKQP